MKIRIGIFLLISGIVLPSIVCAQQFYFKCNYKKKSLPPELYDVPQDNVFDMYNRISLIKDSDSSAYVILKPSEISFLKISADVVLVKPGEHVEGIFNSHGEFYPSDSGTVNFKLRKISDGFSSILIHYPIGADFENFKAVFASLKHYVDSTDEVLNKDIKPWHDSRVELTLKEYLQTRLAHFFVLPVLFKNDYDKKELVTMIQKNLQIKFPEYWLQLEPGRIFLHYYYRKIVLPDSKFDLQKSLSGKLYSIPDFRKLAVYDYFRECLERGIEKNENSIADGLQTNSIQITIVEKRAGFDERRCL
jgi:hypothetical protein